MQRHISACYCCKWAMSSRTHCESSNRWKWSMYNGCWPACLPVSSFDLLLLFIFLFRSHYWCRYQWIFHTITTKKKRINFHIIIIISSAVTYSTWGFFSAFFAAFIYHPFIIIKEQTLAHECVCVCVLACGNIEEIQIELPPPHGRHRVISNSSIDTIKLLKNPLKSIRRKRAKEILEARKKRNTLWITKIA